MAGFCAQSDSEMASNDQELAREQQEPPRTGSEVRRIETKHATGGS